MLDLSATENCGQARNPIALDLVFCHLNHSGEKMLHAFMNAAYPGLYWYHQCSEPESFNFGPHSEITFTVNLVCRILPRPMRALGLNALITKDHLGPCKTSPLFLLPVRDPIDRLCLEFSAYRKSMEKTSLIPDLMRNLASDIVLYQAQLGRSNLLTRLLAQVDLAQPLASTELKRALFTVKQFVVISLDGPHDLADGLLRVADRLPDDARSPAKAFLASGQESLHEDRKVIQALRSTLTDLQVEQLRNANSFDYKILHAIGMEFE